MMDAERLESDREFREAVSPLTIELCAVCREPVRQCECQANNANRRQQAARMTYATFYEAKFERERMDDPAAWVIRTVGTPQRPSYELERIR